MISSKSLRFGAAENTLLTYVRVVLILMTLYIFLVSIGMLGSGFKLFGKGFALALIETTNNPFVGLFVGILVTALIQSSSTTTSITVAFVASGTLSITNAVPVIMGANIGTAITAILVSLGHIGRVNEFKRAFAAGTVHDMFNLLTVAVLLPIELATGFLSKTAGMLAGLLANSSGMEFKSPLKLITQPLTSAIIKAVVALDFDKVVTGILVVVLGITLLILSLIVLTKLLKVLVMKQLQHFFEESFYANGIVAIAIGMVFTAIVQSSSVTTSLMIPLAAAGIMRLDQVFPVALGANIGTTISALLASLATGSPAGLTIALVHLLFNISGTLLFYPVPFMRQIPLQAATLLSNLTVKSRFFAVVFVLAMYFLIPGIAIFIM